MKKGKILDKGAMIDNYLIWLLIGFVILVVSVIGVMILSGKGFGGLDFIKDIFRFGS